jgi:hypothetical protein
MVQWVLVTALEFQNALHLISTQSARVTMTIRLDITKMMVIGSMTTMLQLTPVLARMHMLELMEAPMY